MNSSTSARPPRCQRLWWLWQNTEVGLAHKVQ
jgi:hypothetical protein